MALNHDGGKTNMSPRMKTFAVLAICVAALLVLALVPGCGEKKSASNGDDKTQTSDKDTSKKVEEKLAWPTRFHDGGRAGLSPFDGTDSNTQKWVHDAGAPISTMACAVIGKDGSVIAGFDGKVVAVDPGSGTAVWEYPTGAATTSCTVADDGAIYTGAGNVVHALDPAGAAKWTFDVGSVVEPPSPGSDGTVYAGSAGGRLVALSPDGALKWEFQGEGNLHSPAVDAGGNLYCGGAPYVLYALDKDGNKKWEFKVPVEMATFTDLPPWTNALEEPSIGSDGTLYSGAMKWGMDQIAGMVYAVSPEGALKWEHTGGEYSIHSPTIGSDGTLYAGTTAMKFVALNPADGSLKWEFMCGDGISTCPYVMSPTIGKNGLLYASTSEARIHCADIAGNEKWQFQVDAPAPGGSPHNFMPPAIDSGGTIYATISLGRIYAIGR